MLFRSKSFQVPSNKNAKAPPQAPDFSQIKFINYDFAKYGSSAERRRLLSKRARLLVHAVLAMALLQVALGISTLLLVVPVPLALAHQTGALTLLTLALCLAHTVRAPAREPGYAQTSVSIKQHVKPAE